MKVKILRENGGFLPTRATSCAAGLDLMTPQDITIHPWNKILVSLGICIEFPTHVYGHLASRSSLSCQFGLEVGAGIIDQDYRGEIKVLLYNLSDQTVSLKRGTKIAQMILTPVRYDSCVLSETLNDATERGANGFGSTGL